MVADTKHIIHVDTSKDSACVLLSQEEVAGSIPSVEVVGSLPKTKRCQALAALIHIYIHVHTYIYTYVHTLGNVLNVNAVYHSQNYF